MWIKICGITSLEDGKMAVAAGANAVGFVFAESPRRMAPDAAYNIVVKLPKSVEKIGVFVDSDFERVLSAIQVARLTGVQLHGENSSELAQKIRERADKVALKLHVVRVLHYGHNAQDLESTLRASRGNGTSDSLLVDTAVEGRHGGTGIPFDWRAASHIFREHSSHLRIIVAGGLNPDNVGNAVRTLRPWGVDVSSGVEASPGRKDLARVAQFIRKARAAAFEIADEHTKVNTKQMESVS